MRFCWILLYIFRTMYRYLLLLFITLLFNPVKGQEVSHVHSVHHTFIENKGQWEDHVFFKNKFDGEICGWNKDGFCFKCKIIQCCMKPISQILNQIKS